ncbi:hypothetical protein [Rhodoplanes roseus]|uniref:Uncharacterized protein n=1 Tax=Rhodoplanes roseus TaxID=29409 RepID=A0A327KJ31_9BRAD|nr:hypothetical protein [Rhodoplanes roseus]RAI38497.1 hypothetical protein CH341_27745 [Rhodoplanes roseus]
MTIDEFRRLAETWGGDVERWPEPLRAEARALARSPGGTAVLAAERRLDLALGDTPVVTRRRADDVAFRVLQQIADATPRGRERVPATLPSRLRWLFPAASLAASVLLGVSLAVELPFSAAPPAAATILAMTVDSGSMASDWGLP